MGDQNVRRRVGSVPQQFSIEAPSKRGSGSRPKRPLSITPRGHHGNGPASLAGKGAVIIVTNEAQSAPLATHRIAFDAVRRSCIAAGTLPRQAPQVPCPCRRPSGPAGHKRLSRAGYRGAEGQARLSLSRHPGCSRIVLALGINVRNASLLHCSRHRTQAKNSISGLRQGDDLSPEIWVS